MANDTPANHLEKFKWKPGVSANPAGRPKGARCRLQEDFLRDVQAAWETSGTAAIAAMIEDKPGEFVKMIAGLLPKEATLFIDDAASMTEGELVERLRNITATIAPFLISGGGEANETTEGDTIEAVATRVH